MACGSQPEISGRSCGQPSTDGGAQERDVGRVALRRAGPMPPDARNRPQFGVGEMGNLVRVVSDREIEIGES